MGYGTLPVVIDDPTPSSDWQLLGNSQASLCAWLMKDRWSFSPPRTIPFRLYLQHFMCILIVLKEAEYGIYFQAKILLYEVRFLTIFFASRPVLTAQYLFSLTMKTIFMSWKEPLCLSGSADSFVPASEAFLPFRSSAAEAEDKWEEKCY